MLRGNDSDESNPAAVAILLFDGECCLCSACVDFLIRRDPKAVFRFAALQSPAGRRLLDLHGLASDAPQTLVLLDEGRAYTRSGACLRIARRLRFPWPAFYALVCVPLPLRDWVYNRVAASRYRVFGKREECRVPTSEERDRFIT